MWTTLTPTFKQKQDNKTLKEIKNKVNTNNLIITKADKSQATVIIDKTDKTVHQKN